MLSNIRTMGIFAPGKHIYVYICVSQLGEHISIGICVSQVGKHISLGICVSQLGEHISLGICVSKIGEQISLRMCFPGRRTPMIREMYLSGSGNTFNYGYVLGATYITVMSQ